MNKALFSKVVALFAPFDGAEVNADFFASVAVAAKDAGLEPAGFVDCDGLEDFTELKFYDAPNSRVEVVVVPGVFVFEDFKNDNEALFS